MAGKILDNGALITLGIVGVVATVGAALGRSTRGSASHDYDPSWDYEVRKRPLPAVASAVKAAEGILKDFCDLLDLPTPTIHYVTDTGDHLARYVNGTSTAPVFVVNDRALAATAKRHGVKLRDAVESTLLHEAGHAYVDSSGMSGEWDDEEDLVEEPARVFFRNGDIENAARSLREGVDARLEDE